MRTGYPVMVVVVITVADAAATEIFFSEKMLFNDIGLIACMMTGRNNKMKYLIAKYF
jgi:hypothetical protein